MKLTKRIYIVLIICMAGCAGNSIQDEKAYLDWLRNPDNKLIIHKYINGFNISARYLPPEYLAYNEIKNQKNTKQRAIDSLLQTYVNSMTFLLTIAPDENSGTKGNVMFYAITRKEEYKIRVQEMNFNMDEYISLKTGKNEYFPVLHHMENLYEAADYRNIYLVFTGNKHDNDLFETGKLELVFRDELFMTGISHFVFYKKHLDKTPKINFWNKKH